MARKVNKPQATSPQPQSVWTPLVCMSPLSVVLCAAPHTLNTTTATHTYRFVASPLLLCRRLCLCLCLVSWWVCVCLPPLGFVAPCIIIDGLPPPLSSVVLPFGTLGSRQPPASILWSSVPFVRTSIWCRSGFGSKFFVRLKTDSKHSFALPPPQHALLACLAPAALRHHHPPRPPKRSPPCICRDSDDDNQSNGQAKRPGQKDPQNSGIHGSNRSKDDGASSPSSSSSAQIAQARRQATKNGSTNKSSKSSSSAWCVRRVCVCS